MTKNQNLPKNLESPNPKVLAGYCSFRFVNCLNLLNNEWLTLGVHTLGIHLIHLIHYITICIHHESHLEIDCDALQHRHGWRAVLVVVLGSDGVVRADAEVTQLHESRLVVQSTQKRQRVFRCVATLVGVTPDHGNLKLKLFLNFIFGLSILDNNFSGMKICKTD